MNIPRLVYGIPDTAALQSYTAFHAAARRRARIRRYGWRFVRAVMLLALGVLIGMHVR